MKLSSEESLSETSVETRKRLFMTAVAIIIHFKKVFYFAHLSVNLKVRKAVTREQSTVHVEMKIYQYLAIRSVPAVYSALLQEAGNDHLTQLWRRSEKISTGELKQMQFICCIFLFRTNVKFVLSTYRL